ncbi:MULTISPECIES: Co2+/Mg2+ efflux protein ApaG [unclassified Saccharibacter]|uniref:Co2+/Mg2+ efflux protein ApaG n=1 Tax=unclassified Saccharibacter TaxID=2648722 RepID=UPI0019291FB1|nr:MULTISPECIES: Co2+/Mg2+ efflux protein ApaG [unclassified Saccharibacter]
MSDDSSHTATTTRLDLDTAEELKAPPCYTATTHDVVVSVRTFWLEEHSTPEESQYAWLYHVVIDNGSSENLQLLSRSWTTLDANGQREDTQGLGVVGEQPFIAAKGQYQYTSGAELKTPTGFMKGLFHMIAPDSRQHFDITIPTVSLDSPHHGGLIH